MSEMVERVARAICQPPVGDYSGDWRDFIPEARAAIEAMREPTEGMLEAGSDRLGDNADQLCDTDAGAALVTYHAMIDEALR